MDSAISLLRDLVAIDSRNPLLVQGVPGEQAIAGHLLDVFRAAGLDAQIHDAAEGRPNVIGVLEGRAPGRTLMYCGHTDTVGVEGMPAPFDPVIKDGRLYGRGSQDMKGGVAAMVDAARVIVGGGGLDAGQLLIACVVDEEHASIGADALVARWRADGAVVTEPTDQAIAIAHKGFEWVEIETEGRAAHGSRPRDGRDAILTFSIDLWNLTFPAPGDYSFRLLVNGSERKRLPLLLLRPPEAADHGTRPGDA